MMLVVLIDQHAGNIAKDREHDAGTSMLFLQGSSTKSSWCICRGLIWLFICCCAGAAQQLISWSKIYEDGLFQTQILILPAETT